MKSFLDTYEITLDEFTELVDQNPSLRGFILGYIGEAKAKKLICSNPDVSHIYKPDDHNRKSKGDLYIEYKGKEFKIEVKSLQTNSVQQIGPDSWTGKYQCDASDSREVLLPNGNTVKTTSLLVGEFDIVAVGLYQFGRTWRFAFAKNAELPRSQARKATKKSPALSAEDANYLIKGTLPISYPLTAPYTDDLFALLDSMLNLDKDEKV